MFELRRRFQVALRGRLKMTAAYGTQTRREEKISLYKTNSFWEIGSYLVYTMLWTRGVDTSVWSDHFVLYEYRLIEMFEKRILMTQDTAELRGWEVKREKIVRPAAEWERVGVGLPFERDSNARHLVKGI